MSLFSRGAHLDTAYRKLAYKVHQRTSPLDTGLVSLAHHQSPVFDQGSTSSCEGHRASMALTVAYRAAGLPLPYIPSPDAIYRDARCVARRPVGGSLPRLVDDGCMTGDVYTALATCGIRPFDDSALTLPRNTDCNPDTINREPLLGELVAESERIITGEYSIPMYGGPLQKVLNALQSGAPVGLDVWIDRGFEAWGHNPVSPLSKCDKDDAWGGWHAILCTEMLVTPGGDVILSGPNSWGDWGAPSLDGNHANGHWRATANWVLIAADGAQVWSVECVG